MTGPGYQSSQSFQNITTHHNHLSSQRSHQDAVRTAQQHAFDSSRRHAQYHHRSGRAGGSAVGRLIGRVVSLALLVLVVLVAVKIAERAGIDLISLLTDLV